MNILFITDTDISPFSGGVERFTHNLSREFMNRNVNCYLAYFKPWHNENTTDFKDKIQLSINTLSDDLAAYIAKNKIDFVLIQLSKKANISVLMPIIYRVTRVSENCKVIYGFYNMPGFELVGIDINLAIYRIYHGQNLKENLNGMMIRIFTKLHLDSIPKIFVANKLKKGLYSDLIFLLSPQYIPIYKNFIGNRNLIKFEAIGNPLSYPQNIPQSEISKKEKVVINVSRYCDSHKRQSLALKIWKIIESNPNCKEWKLLMIGYGEDEKYIKRIAKKLGLHNIEFQGMQNPIEHYKRAAIYMMTSAFEGFPMVLLDIQQFGIVPIAFDSFAAIYDIIENEKNGFIIPNNELQQYAAKLIWLMEHKEDREKMALTGLESCQRFAPNIVVNKWIKMLEDMNKE